MQPTRYIVLFITCWLAFCQAQGQDSVLAKKDTARILESVTVNARKPLVTRMADRYVVNVENSFLANGFSALEVLQKSPGLWVSPDGSIRLTGNQSVTVMINDIVQRMSGIELAEYLKTLRSEDISKIEIIPNPPAEYEAAASGGILHIILKKSRQQGVSGAVYTQYKQQGSKPYAATGASLDYKHRHWYLFGNYSYTIDKSRYTGYTVTDYPDNSHYDSRALRNNNNTRQQYRSGFVYDIVPAHTVTLQHNGSSNKLLQYFYSGITNTLPAGSVVTGDANTAWLRKPGTASTTASYAWSIDSLGSALKVIADYTRSSKQETNVVASFYSDTAASNSIRSATPGETDLYTIQTDYNQVLRKKMMVRLGLKYVHTTRHNTVLAEEEEEGRWIKNEGGSNEFLYKEALLMCYGAIEKQVHATSVKAGLRGEQTTARGTSLTSGQVIGRSYFGLFSSLFIAHSLNEGKGNVLQLNYSRRVRRPAYNDLNPYRLQLNDYAVLTGNPDLLPQYTHSLQAGYVWHKEYSAELYYKHTNNFIAATARTINDKVIEHMSKNFPGNTEWGLSLNAPLPIAGCWRSTNSFLLYRAISDLQEVIIRRTSFSVKSVHTVEWKNVFDLDCYLEYNSPYTSANARMAEYFYTDVGMVKSVLNKKLRIRISVSDIFNTAREKELVVYNATRIEFYQKRPTRTAGIALSWSFRAGKSFTKKKIDANNTDEKSRIGN